MERELTPTPVPVDPLKERTTGTAIYPSTPVSLSVRTAIVVIMSIVTLVLGGAGGYYALAGTDRAHAEKIQRLEQSTQAFATKADLRTLRMQVRMDLLNAVMKCAKDAEGGMVCSMRLPREYDDGQ